MSKIELITFTTHKYCEQVVAIKGKAGSYNMRLFDAVELFMKDDLWSERQRVKEEARQWAEAFVAQMNNNCEGPAS